MIVFACFWDGSGSQAEAVCRINASGGKQKMERRVRAWLRADFISKVPRLELSPDFALNLTVAIEPAQPLESGHKFYSYDCQEQVRKERGLGGQPKWGGY